MLDRIRSLAKEYRELQHSLEDPSVHGDPKQLASIGKRMAELEPLVSKLDEYDRLGLALDEAEESLVYPELHTLAEQQAHSARERRGILEQEMRAFLLPRDPDDNRSVILEVRAGAGGEEAALFASQLLRMYLRFSEIRKWKTQILSKSDAEGGGIKEASCKIEGAGVFGELKFESGVHRVQRIPSTEAKGRVHTSTATVAILPEAEDVDIVIRTEDLRIDTYRSGGAGGQNVNKVETAVRITHMPTNTVVACQSERSQLQNRTLAMKMLRTRLYASERERLAKERGEMRAGQVGSADRSEKIRTYNFPQDRVTDHRIGRNFSNLPSIMEGNIQDIITAMREADREARLSSLKDR